MGFQLVSKSTLLFTFEMVCKYSICHLKDLFQSLGTVLLEYVSCLAVNACDSHCHQVIVTEQHLWPSIADL